MSNFFSNGSNDVDDSINLFANIAKNEEMSKDNSLDDQYNELKNNYEQIFKEAAESIRRDLDEIKPQNACNGCSNKDCKIENKDLFAPYPTTGCKLREWQMQSITYLSGNYQTKHRVALKYIMDKRDKYECNKCGACCKLAVSEYSYTQLKQRAMKGDKFAEDFVSVFVPYATEEEAKSVNPEFFALLNRLVEEEKIYYYYCPKLGSDNLCTMYEDRPNVCKDYPNNPLRLLPSTCSFNVWKKEVAYRAMLLKAKIDIIEYYKEKLS